MALETPYLWLLALGIPALLLMRIVYRLSFHPLSSIPGPKLAAATSLYEFYYNVVRPGIYLFEIEKMHRQYGPIVRITPREVHICDPAFYDEIYASSKRRRDKDPQNVRMFGIPVATAATVPHDLHRFRRSILEGFFSKRSVMSLAGLVDERLQKLMARFEESRIERTVVSLDDAFTALTSDIITSICCGKHWGFVEDKNFRNDIRKAVDDMVKFSHINHFVPLLVDLPRYVPVRLLAMLMPGKAAMLNFLTSYKLQALATANDIDSSSNAKGIGTEQTSSNNNGSTRTTMMAALADPSIPAAERDHDRLQDEVSSILVAGSETTAHILTFAIYQLTVNEGLMQRLRAELQDVFSLKKAPTWTDLEALPYLNGVICETLRTSHALIGRLPRVAPTESLVYGRYVIPPGTSMSSSSYFVHRDPTIFPDPLRFDPERWIKAAENGEYLKRYLVTFTKGSRGCIGINLAYMELFLALAHFVHRFNVQLVDTEPDDVRLVRDMNMGYTKRGPLKVFARISSARLEGSVSHNNS